MKSIARLITAAAIVLFSINVQAQELKILVNKKGKIGFADQNGNVVIKCQYESAQPFTSDGIAIVTKSGKSGIINTSGKVLLPLKYSQIYPWNSALYMIKDGKKMGLANHKGKVVLPVNYSHISKPNQFGRALIAKGGKASKNDKKTYMAKAKYGIIDSEGDILIEPKYKGLYEFANNNTSYPFREGKRLLFSYHNITDTLETDCSYMGYSNNAFSINKAGILDRNGKVLLKNGQYYYVMQPQSNMTRYYIVKKKETLYGYYNLSTGKGFQVDKYDKSIGDMGFWSHGDFIGDIAPVNGSTWSFIDKSGKQLRTGYSAIRHSQTTALWAAQNASGKWDVFNENNEDVKDLSDFDDIIFPNKQGDKEIFSVAKDGKYGCITRNGNMVVPFDYEMAMGNTYDVIPVKKDGKWGLLSADNTCFIPNDYANIMLPTERNATIFWVQKSDSLYYHYNMSTGKTSSNGYKTVSNFQKGFAYVVPQNLEVEDTPINRAQIYEPNTPKKTIDALDISKHLGEFVNIINDKDEMVFDLPVSTMYYEKIRDEIIKRGKSTLTVSEKKNILLEATRENRSYDLKSTLGEEEWNY